MKDMFQQLGKEQSGRLQMSMRGNIISREYQDMVFVRDDKGGEYVCYAKDLKNPEHVSESEKEFCLDSSLVLGPNW